MTAAKLNRIDPATLANNPRATLAAWRKYEPIVIAAHNKYPEPFMWSPSPHNLSCQTVVSRIRDAIRGKIAFDYPSTVSGDDISLWFSQVIFKVVRSHVYIGNKSALATAATPLVTDTYKGDLVFDSITQPELDAFALLLSNGRLSGPIIIRQPPVDYSYPVLSNFHIIPRPDGSLVLL